VTSDGDLPQELIRLDIPALPAFVGVARVVVVSVATTVDGIADDRLEDLRIAVSEACTNAVEAHAEDGAHQRIVLRCTLADDALTVEIAGEGTAAAGGGTGADDEARAESGWGLQLIRALVDDVTFSMAEQGNGSSVRLLVQRTATA
jgi:serine/threonine-protein kinase RsbW